MSSKCVPLWTVLRSREEFGSAGLQLLTVRSESGVHVRNLSDGRAPSEDLSSYRKVAPGDLVVNKLWARFGAYGVAPCAGTISPAYWVLKVDSRFVAPRFLHYLLRSAGYRGEVGRISKDQPPNGYELPWAQFRSVKIPIFPLSSQRSVADFLDAETARIDALVAKKRRLVALLEERVGHLISARIAESSMVEAAGAGAVVPIKKVLTKVERPPTEGAEMITAFRDGQVTARALRRMEGYTQSWTDAAQVQGVRRGDVVIHGLDGFAGAIGVAEVDGVCSPVYHVCQPEADGDPAYLGRMLRNLAVSGYLGLFSSSTRERAVDFRNWDLFGRIPVPSVGSAEQQQVAKLIRRIKPLKDVVEKSAELAAERRHALITAAVTGEPEVPGVAR